MIGTLFNVHLLQIFDDFQNVSLGQEEFTHCHPFASEIRYIHPLTAISDQVLLHKLSNILDSRPHVDFVVIKVHMGCFWNDDLLSRAAN